MYLIAFIPITQHIYIVSCLYKFFPNGNEKLKAHFTSSFLFFAQFMYHKYNSLVYNLKFMFHKYIFKKLFYV